MYRLLRGLVAAAVALFTLGSIVPAKAQTFTQIAWGVARGSSPQPICLLTGPTCLNQIGTVQSNRTFIPSGVVINIQNYIALGESTIDNALTRADAVLTAFGGGILRFPNQSSCYLQTNTHVITADNFTYQGDGFGACINVAVNDDFFRIGDGIANPHFDSIKNLTLNPSGVKTTGAAIRFRNTFGAGASDIICGSGLNVCIDVDGGVGATLPNQYATHLKRISCFGGVSCIRLGNAAGEAQETWIIDSSPAAQTTAGVEIINAGGTHLRQNSYLANLHAMYVHPSTGQFATAIDSLNEVMDSSWDSCLLIDASGGGTVAESVFTALWSSTCSSTVGTHTGTNNPGLWIKGTEATVRGLQFTGLRAVNSGGVGVRVEGGRDLDFDGHVMMNSISSLAGFNGYSFAAGVSHWSVRGRSGALGTHIPAPNKQAYGVAIDCGASDYYQVVGDFSGNQSGPVLDCGTGSNKRINALGYGVVESALNATATGYTILQVSRDGSVYPGLGNGGFSLVTPNSEQLLFGVHDTDYSWIQAVKPGVTTRNLALQPIGGNVGIGNLAPGTALDVTGTIRGSAAPIFTACTGYLKGNGAGASTCAATVPLSDLATQATNTIVGNATSGTAAPTALAIGSCSTASSALTWTTNTGFACNTSITANSVPAANLTGTTLASGVVTSSLTTVGTIGSGTWQGTIIAGQFGGTGIANTGKTITIGASLTTTGAGAPTLAFSASPFTYTFQGSSDTIVGRATTDTLTNKTYDTAGTGNSFSINGLAATANTGTGAVVRATSPTLVTPALGTPSSINLSNATNLAPAALGGMSQTANSLGADVVLNNTATFFDGPSVAQGTSGTWCASGTVTVDDSNGAALYVAKLWDGTTNIQTPVGFSPVGFANSISVSGCIVSPAGNIRISVRDASSTGGKIRFNASGLSKDSTLTVWRVN